MNDFMPKWQQFQNKIKVHNDLKKKKAILQEKLEILNEISTDAAEKIYDWMSDKEITDYDFDELFGGAMRIALPLESSDDKNLADIIWQLHHEGWQPDKSQQKEPSGDELEIMSTMGVSYLQGEQFPIELVKQKKRRLETGEEYEENEVIAKLNLKKTTTKVIPKGPKAGQEIQKTEQTTISRAINKSKDIEPRLKEWWQKKQTFYTKEQNWRQVARVFSNAAYEREPVGDMSVIISRHPIDVLRMSDIDSISSCHSEGSSHFKCAVAEAKGHGPIAYLVATNDLENFLTDAPYGYDADVADTITTKDISDFDDKEIFRDSRRGVEGIGATQRVRLRKFEDTDSGVVFVAPESRTYGRKIPGFVSFVREWAAENQKKYFVANDDGDLVAPEFTDLYRHGGSYGDTRDGEALNKFFEKMGVDADYYDGSDVNGPDEEEDEGLWDEYEQRVEELTDYANNNLKHASVYAEVDEVDAGEPYVMMSATYGVEFPDSMFEDEHPGFDDWQTTVQIKDTIESIIDDMNLYIHFEDMNINHWGSTVSFNFDIPRDDYGGTPDDLEQFIDWIEREYDGEHEDIVEAVRKALVKLEYISPQPFDVKAAQLEEEEPEYEHWDYDVESRSIIFNTGYSPRLKLAQTNQRVHSELKYPIQDYNPRTSWSPSFYKNMTKELQKLEAAAQEYAHKQLTLPGVEMAAADKVLSLPLLTKRKSKTGKFEAILTISLPERFDASTSEMWLLLRMELDITPEATDVQIQAVSKFVEYVDKHMDDVFAAARRAMKPLMDETKVRRELEAKLPTREEISKHLKEMPIDDLIDFAKGFVAAGLWDERVTRIVHWRGELKKSAEIVSKEAAGMLSFTPDSPRAQAAERLKNLGEEIAKIADAPVSEMIELSNAMYTEAPNRWHFGRFHDLGIDPKHQFETLTIFTKDFIDLDLSGAAVRVHQRFMFAAGLEKYWYDAQTDRTVAIEDQDRSSLDPAQIMSTKPSTIKPPAWYTDVFNVIGLKEHRRAIPEKVLREAIRRAVLKSLNA